MKWELGRECAAGKPWRTSVCMERALIGECETGFQPSPQLQLLPKFTAMQTPVDIMCSEL